MSSLSPDRGYIGGGNIAGILGLSPFKSPLDEFLTITGQAMPTTPEKEAFFKRRKALEPFAAEAFELATGVKIVRRNERYGHDAFDFLKAEIDFETSDDCTGETKTVNTWAAKHWGESGGDDCPTYVTAQAMWGLGLDPLKRKRAYVHAVIGLDEDRIYLVERDDETIRAMQNRAVIFWNDHVLPMVPPDPVNLDDVLRLFPTDRGSVIEADDDIQVLMSDLKQKDADLKALEDVVDALKDRARIFMGPNAVLSMGGTPLATWKAQTARRFNQDAFKTAHPDLFEQFKHSAETRVFRIK